MELKASLSVQELFEKECQMALQDRVQEETSERKNALEAYIYSLRNKLADSLASYVTETEAETTRQKLDAAEVKILLPPLSQGPIILLDTAKVHFREQVLLKAEKVSLLEGC